MEKNKKSQIVGALMKMSDWNEMLRQYRSGNFDMLELRLDAFSKTDLVKLHAKVLAEKKLPPLLITVRSKKEGGRSIMSLCERKRRFGLFAKQGKFFDSELSSPKLTAWLKENIIKRGKKLVLSSHDFKNPPTSNRIKSLLLQSKKYQPDVIKFAFTIKKQSDLLPLFALLGREKKTCLALIGMDKIGEISRILLPALGSYLTYGHFGSKSAPGQMSVVRLKKQLKKIV